MDLAERTSLGELLAILTKTGKLSSSVISTLWSLFGSKNKTVGAEVKLNCLILLGMIGKSDREMLLNNLDSLTRLGLGSLVTPDLNVSKYACVAIQQIFATTRQKGVSEKPIQRFQHDHPTSERLVELLKCPPSSSNWFSFAEQAINTLYISTENPDVLCAEIIKLMALRVFPNLPQNTEENINALADQVNQITLDNAKNNPLIGDSEEVMLQKCMDLSYLLFVVGHVAIQQLVNLERIETEWKRKKHAKDGEKGKETTNEDLEMTTGTAEDEFIDVMTAVKERELVFGPNTLLSTFAPVIVYICSNRQKFNVLFINHSIQLCKLFLRRPCASSCVSPQHFVKHTLTYYL